VRELIATKEGIERWWTGRPVDGTDGHGGELRVYFGDRDRPAAGFKVAEQTAEEIVWRCIDGPQEWRETRICFHPRPSAGGGTTLLFSREGWQQESEFMHGCSTNWAAYLMSLKAGAEGREFGPYPAGEMSRWD
jgi:Activator of Hsp90 ATPase homolog 1-like protein